jgi:CBS domain containing-hemolysin-like protein
LDIINLLLIALLIVATAFFVASEFAVVKVRASRIDQLVAEGHPKAPAVKKVIENLDGYLSACQLGITITALGLGMLGKPTVESLLFPVFVAFDIPKEFSDFLSYAIAFGSITFLHVVIGELAPKSIAIQKAEEVSLWLAKPLIWFYVLLYPFIWTLNGSARVLVRMFGFAQMNEHDSTHSEEELRILMSQSLKSGQINKSEYKYVEKVFEFDDRIAKEIMVPRTQMVCLSADASFEENLNIIKSEQFTRYPVIVEEDKDNVIGIVNTKELFLAHIQDIEIRISDYLRPVLSVIETVPVQSLLRRMQQEQVHMTVLIDEYGGTAGLITIEDIIEEIVGEIRDEFDAEERDMVEKVQKDNIIIDGKVLIAEVNELLGLNLDDEEIDTISGWLYTQIPDISEGVKYEHEGYLYTIVEMDRLRISKVEIKKQAAQEKPLTPVEK